MKTPQEITEAGIATGVAKAELTVGKVMVGSFLAGAYIAFGGLLAIMVSSGVDSEVFGTLDLFFRGLVFSLGLILVIIAGSELLTGNMALVPIANMARRTPVWRIFPNFLVVLIFNFLGAVFVAYVFAVQSGVITAELPLAELEEIVLLKGVEETNLQIFIRAMGANWLVCLAVWLALAADDVGGKILAIIFPILAFVAMGFDHVIANMFFLPAGIFAGIDITWFDAANNFLWAFLGNFVGAAVFVSGAYFFLYGRPAKPTQTPSHADGRGGDGHREVPQEREPGGAGSGAPAPAASPREPAGR
ncbi:MAG: formate/nitrite transporter family protein [Actinomycetota bacterium]|nr:formate/nitrite transporter family protein [Actinomycetota bacterium]